MGRMSRQKGKRGEREAAAELATLLGCTARRGVQYQGGPASPDVVLEGVNIHVEAKRVEALNLYAAIEQAKTESGSKVPMVWHRRNGKQSVVIVETNELINLAREIVRVTQNDTAESARHKNT